LAVGAYSALLVRVLIVLVGVISWPISKVLDWALGSEHGVCCVPSLPPEYD
jgi:metal transporter CNNM